MKAQQRLQSVARKHPLLYIYAGASFIWGGAYALLRLHVAWNSTPAAGYSMQEQHHALVVGGVIAMVLMAALYLYLIMAKNSRVVELILKILLGLQLLSVIFSLFRLSTALLPDVIQAAFTYYVLRNVSGKKDFTLF